VDLARQGTGVIVISDELPELIGLCDRIMVMARGTKTREFLRGEVNQNQLLAAIVSQEKGDGADAVPTHDRFNPESR
jgi:ABC-type sugar transport system ATPase subunit